MMVFSFPDTLLTVGCARAAPLVKQSVTTLKGALLNVEMSEDG
jgi:hypothetical protein